MKKIAGLLMVCFTFSFCLQAQSKEEKEVATAVETFRKALLDGNRAQLEKVVADELSYGHSNGKLEDKAAFVEAYASGKSDFETIDLTDQTIRVVGNTAVVRHKLAGKTMDEGKPGNANLGVLLVWVNRQGQWRLLARQAFKL